MLHKCGAQESVVQREKEGMATQAKYLVHALRDGDKSEHSGKNDGGVVGGCAELCHFLPSQVLDVACNLLCDFVGIKEFIKIINQYVPPFFCVFFSYVSCDRMRRKKGKTRSYVEKRAQ